MSECAKAVQSEPAAAPWRQTGKGVLQSKTHKLQDLQNAVFVHVKEHQTSLDLLLALVESGTYGDAATSSEVADVRQQAIDSMERLAAVTSEYVKWLASQEHAKQLMKTALSRNPPSIDELQHALAQARSAGLSSEETQHSREALALEKERAAAREALQAILSAENPAVPALQNAVQKAEAAKLPQFELEAARQVLTLQESRLKAREALKKAFEVKVSIVPALRAALQQAEAAKLPVSEIEPGRKALALEEKRVKAREALQDALSSQMPTVDALQNAIIEAEAANLHHIEIEPAKQALAFEKERVSARLALSAALSSKVLTIDSLSKALQQAETAKLPQSEVETAKAALALEHKRVIARDALKEAMLSQTPNICMLRDAILLADIANLPSAEIEPAKKAVAVEEGRIIARDALKAALSSKVPNIIGLRKALKQAEAATLTQSELQPAKDVLSYEEKRLQARNVLRAVLSSQEPAVVTITEALKLGEDAQLPLCELEPIKTALVSATKLSKARGSVQAALASEPPSISSLRDALKQAEAAKLPQMETLELCKVLAKEESREAARLAITSAINNCASNDPNEALQQLRDALVKGEAQYLNDTELQPVREAINKESIRASALAELVQAMDDSENAGNADTLKAALDTGKFLSLPGDLLARGEKTLQILELVIKMNGARREDQEAKQMAREAKRARRKLEMEVAQAKGLPLPRKSLRQCSPSALRAKISKMVRSVSRAPSRAPRTPANLRGSISMSLEPMRAVSPTPAPNFTQCKLENDADPKPDSPRKAAQVDPSGFPLTFSWKTYKGSPVLVVDSEALHAYLEQNRGGALEEITKQGIYAGQSVCGSFSKKSMAKQGEWIWEESAVIFKHPCDGENEQGMSCVCAGTRGKSELFRVRVIGLGLALAAAILHPILVTSRVKAWIAEESLDRYFWQLAKHVRQLPGAPQEVRMITQGEPIAVRGSSSGRSRGTTRGRVPPVPKSQVRLRSRGSGRG